ncbi:MAG: hypothetical protein HGA95_01550, partial [Caldiserica bacterium]|nr:hypothetical protein [Caldisericota bacterium]
MGAIAYYTSLRLNFLVDRSSNLGRIVQVGFAIVLGIVVYCVIMWIIDNAEVKEFIAVIRRRGDV